MYESHVLYAIQNNDIEDFHLRYRIFNSKTERDDALAFMQGQARVLENFVPVTLTITATEIFEQTRLEV